MNGRQWERVGVERQRLPRTKNYHYMLCDVGALAVCATLVSSFIPTIMLQAHASTPSKLHRYEIHSSFPGRHKSNNQKSCQLLSEVSKTQLSIIEKQGISPAKDLGPILCSPSTLTRSMFTENQGIQLPLAAWQVIAASQVLFHCPAVDATRNRPYPTSIRNLRRSRLLSSLFRLFQRLAPRLFRPSNPK